MVRVDEKYFDMKCPKCKNKLIVKRVKDDNSTLFSRLFGKDGHHREMRCPACNWTGRTSNWRELKGHKPKVGGQTHKEKERKNHEHRGHKHRHHKGRSHRHRSHKRRRRR